MKAVKIILVILALAFLAIQFIPNKIPENKAVTKEDIVSSENLPENIVALLKTSCYDCHSNQTHFPWYAKIAPTSWLLADDIKGGRNKLNFSEWSGYSKRRKISKLGDIKDEITSGGMPLPAYTFIHRRSKLSKEQVSVLAKWTEDMANSVLK